MVDHLSAEAVESAECLNVTYKCIDRNELWLFPHAEKEVS